MESQDFILKTEYIDLSQLLKATGLAMSGGEAKMFVTEGMVFVNDEYSSPGPLLAQLVVDVILGPVVLLLESQATRIHSLYLSCRL